MEKEKQTTKMISLSLAILIFITSCTSTTKIITEPSGAKVYVEGEAVGTTPYKYKDSKIVGSKTALKLEKEDYETLEVNLSRNEVVDVGAVLGGIVLLFPFLWTMGYKPTHTYELKQKSNK
jgi:hypothetical protein